jgi:deazaflavin-dependent oxidoreductase (nitroreductase family)
MNEAIRQAIATGQTIDITTRGRRTGQPRRIELVFHNFGGRIFLRGMPSPRRRSWVANIDADPQFTFHLKGRGATADLAATGRVITDDAERRAIMPLVAAAWRRRDVDEMILHSPLVEVDLVDLAA